MKISVIIGWVTRITAAIILLQTLFFKFTGAQESIYIFETVGIEPWGRYLIGIIELAASVLFFIPRKAWLGAFLALGVMAGAIISHLTVLGIEVQEDGGTLFILAWIVFFCSIFILYQKRGDIPVVGSKLSETENKK